MEWLQLKSIQYESLEYRAALRLRDEILRRPLGLAIHPGELMQERLQLHFGAFFKRELVATAVLVVEGVIGKMRQVAVIPEYQRQRVGGRLVTFLEQEAISMRLTEIYCHARDQAVPFYKRAGYLPDGEYFEEVGIRHMKMRKWLL